MGGSSFGRDSGGGMEAARSRGQKIVEGNSRGVDTWMNSESSKGEREDWLAIVPVTQEEVLGGDIEEEKGEGSSGKRKKYKKLSKGTSQEKIQEDRYGDHHINDL